MNYKYGTRIKLPRITSILQTNFYAQYERERDCLKHTLQYPVYVHDGLSDSKAIHGIFSLLVVFTCCIAVVICIYFKTPIACQVSAFPKNLVYFVSWRIIFCSKVFQKKHPMIKNILKAYEYTYLSSRLNLRL